MIQETGWKVKAFIILALALILIPAVLAITGSGGSMNVQSSIDSAAMGSSTIYNTHASGGMGPAGTYSGGLLNGYFGFGSASDNNPPVVTQLSPGSNSVMVSPNIDFNFTVYDASEISNCTLLIDGASAGLLALPSNGYNSIAYTVALGQHVWAIQCIDQYANPELTGNVSFKVIQASSFDSGSTDLSSVDLSNINDLKFVKSSTGSIEFPGSTDLSSVNDLDSYITISPLRISIDSASLPMLNKSATLTMNSVPFGHALIFKDGSLCTSCSFTSLNSGQLIFGVAGFSTYTATSTSSLFIYDDSDNTAKTIYQNAGFYANFSNTTSFAPINAQCYISFNLSGWTTPVLMNYNSTTRLYEDYSVFNNSMTSQFNVTCNPLVAGFDSLSLIDIFLIAGPTAGRLANINITQGPSSRFIEQVGTPVAASSGNVTEISMIGKTNTRYWQGYYGNISGSIILADAEGYEFYDWSGISLIGEVLASRSGSIDWNSVKCANGSVVDAEDNFMGKLASDVDSVNGTFNLTGHPMFMISNNVVVGCKSTKALGPTSATGYWNALISDNNGTGSMIYASVISQNTQSFQNLTNDFELLVAAPSPVDTTIYQYYFYLELN